MYLYFDKNGILKEVINDKALRQGNYDVNKIYIYIEDLNYTEPQQMDVSYRLSDGTRIPVSAYELNFSAINESDKMEVPYNRRRDLKFFKYGVKYPFYEIPTEFEVSGVQYSALDIPGNVCCTVRVNDGTITTLGLIVFNVEETVDGNVINYEEYISLAQFQYLMSIIVSKDYVDGQIDYNIEDRCICVVDDIDDIDLTEYPVGAIIFSKNNRYYYIVDENNEKQFISSMNKVFKIGSYVVDVTTQLSDEIYELLLNNDDDIVLYVEGDDESKQYFKKAFASNNVIVYLNIDEPSSGSVDFILLAYNKISINMTAKTWIARSHVAVLYERTYIDTQLALKADLSYVNNLVADIKANSFIPIDDYETYPTVADFLSNYPLDEREEGSIYLYPVNIADLTKGYRQFIWEGDAWIYLGNTQLDLSNYYTKAQVLEKIEYIVEMTSGSQTFTGDTLTYLINNPNARIRYNDVLYEKSFEDVNSIRFISVYETSDVSGGYQKLQRPIIVLSKVSGTAGAGQLTKQFYNKVQMDTLLNAKADKTTTTSLQNQINDLNYRLTVVEEAIIGVDTLSFTALSYSAIPNVSDNLYPIIASGGLDTKEINGNSFVHSQLVQNGNFANTSNWYAGQATFSVSNNVATVVPNAIHSSFNQYYAGMGVNGHKYLWCCDIKYTSGEQYFINVLNVSTNNTGTGNWELKSGIITPNNTNDYFNIYDYDSNVRSEYQVKKVMLFDLTKDFGAGNEPATYDQAVSMYASKGIDITNYVEYTQGTLIDSKPTKLISHGYNLCKEQWESGTIYNGSDYPSPDMKRTPSIDKIKVIGGQGYTIEGNETGNYYIFEFDAEMNQIRRDDFNNSQGGNVSLLSNCSYVRLVVPTGLTQCCFHLTGSRTGYAPYKAPIEYPITTEILRSAGSVQDSAVSKKVGRVDLASLSWTSLNGKWVADLPLAKPSADADTIPNIVCDKYEPNTPRNIANQNAVGITLGNTGWWGNGKVAIYDSSITSSSQIAGTLNYELATPTEQTATLPTDIEIEKGGSLEVVYDNGYTTPADFLFDCAVYKPLE